VWRQFQDFEETLPTKNGDYEGWHRGRKEYAAWTIDIQDQPVQSRFDAARAHLSDFLLKPYCRQAHVTLFMCGFLVDVERFDDDFSTDRLERQLWALKEARLAPFEIEIGEVDSFATAPFLEVLDVTDGIEKIRNVLSSTHSEIRETGYVPHVTLGLYSGRFARKMVAERISSLCPESRIIYWVDEIHLMTYSAFEIAGPLKRHCAIHLEQSS
jgi:2'-5' RNA ligase